MRRSGAPGASARPIIGLIQAGSDAGQLHYAFKSLAERLKSELYFQKQLKKATITPGVIIAVLTGAFIVSQVKIVPQVEEMLNGVSAKPDGMTAISFKVSHFTQAVWPVFVISVIAIAVTIVRSAKVRNLILGFTMSKWRLLRLLIMSLRQMTFISTIKLLHSNGINLAKSIRVSANSVRNTPFYAGTARAPPTNTRTPACRSPPLSRNTPRWTRRSPTCSPSARNPPRSTAQLEMLCEMYEEDSQNHMNAFSAAISFIVLIIAVGLIAAVFVGTFLPIFLMGPKMMQSGHLILLRHATHPIRPLAAREVRLRDFTSRHCVRRNRFRPGSAPSNCPRRPGKRYKHLFIAGSSKAADELIRQLKENSQMYTTQVVDREAWYVPFIAPKEKSVTWWLFSVAVISTSAFFALLYLKGLVEDPEFRKNFMEAIEIMKG